MKQSPSEEGKETGKFSCNTPNADLHIIHYKREIEELKSRLQESQEQIKHLVKTMHEQAYDFQTEIDKLRELEKSENQDELITEFIKEFNAAFGGWSGGMNAVKSKFLISRRTKE